MKAILAVAALAYAVFIARTAFLVDGRLHFTLFDDAMISMQYARNLAEGHGLRWNPGEPAVEGFSNLLWTLVMSLFHLSGLPDAWIALLPMLVGAGVLLLIVWLAAQLADTLTGERGSRAGLIAAVLTATCYPLIFWTLRGMEVGLVALFTMGVLWAALDGADGPEDPSRRARHRRQRALIAVAATIALTLTRDDGLVPIAAIAMAAFLWGGRDARRLAIMCVIALVAAKAAHLGWRQSYYGDVVPNTYYLKLTGVSPVARAWAGAVAWSSAVLRQVAPLLVPALLALWPMRDRRRLILLAPFAAVSAYSVSAGGDAWEYFNFANRYVTAALPPVCVLAGVALASGDLKVRSLLIGLGMVMVAGGAWDLAEKTRLDYVPASRLAWGIGMVAAGAALAAGVRRFTRPLTAGAATALLILVSSGRPAAHWLAGNAHAMDNDRAGTALGVAIRETTRPDASVAAFLAGSTPYFAHRRSIDLFGKSDPHVAKLAVTSLHPGHNKVDLPYSLGLEPDLVVTFTDAPPETRTQLEARGYVRLCAPLWARADSRRVDRKRLAARCG